MLKLFKSKELVEQTQEVPVNKYEAELLKAIKDWEAMDRVRQSINKMMLESNNKYKC